MGTETRRPPRDGHQEVGGTRKTVEAGIAFVKEALTDANKVKRSWCRPAS
jgi:hypothetical protein